LRTISNLKAGNFLFRLGVFLLVSAPVLSAILFFFSILISSYKNYKNFFLDKWNYPFFLASLILMFTVSLSSLEQFSKKIEGWSNYLNWVSLFNWIPFKQYLISSKSRKIILLLLLSGSVPLIISGILQFFFDIYGPFKILNGLIIWFQREGEPGLTGLFNNRNYASLWFTILWPICLAILSQRKNGSKLFIYIFSISVISSIYLTFSRNGLINLFLSSLIFLKGSLSIWLFLLLILFITLLIAAKTNIFHLSFKELAINILPPKLLSRFSMIENLEVFTSNARFSIWLSALDFIKERPFLGWGAASFPLLYQLKHDTCCYTSYLQWYGHTHNIQLEMALNYGLPFSFLVNTILIFIFYKSFKKIFICKIKDKSLEEINFNKFDKAWWTSSFTFFFSQLFDIHFYDLRLNIIFWIFISGLIIIIQDPERKNFNSQEI
jgi:O-antigen ligase